MHYNSIINSLNNGNKLTFRLPVESLQKKKLKCYWGLFKQDGLRE